jgi:hypothetical protein
MMESLSSLDRADDLLIIDIVNNIIRFDDDDDDDDWDCGDGKLMMTLLLSFVHRKEKSKKQMMDANK